MTKKQSVVVRVSKEARTEKPIRCRVKVTKEPREERTIRVKVLR